MPYQALYRTYRPRHFSEVIGQDHVVRTLVNSVKQDKVSHAHLFSGPRGTGKTTVARILARAINCEHTADGEPCDECRRCKGSEEGLGVIEIDAASHGSVDDMRQLVAQVSQVPLSGGMMVYIIDEVHMLSKEAFNAFLKTLEEPPPHAVFVLATTEPGKLLPTIHSRCQHFAFRRIPVNIVADHIAGICRSENVPAEDAAIRLIARAGDGSVRDSISILEQAIAYEPGGLTLMGVRDVLGIPDRMDIRALGARVVAGDPAGISASFAHLIESGREPSSILTELLLHFRDLLFAALNLEHSDLEILPDEERREVVRQAAGLSIEEIHRAIAFLAKCEGEIKWEDEAALILEVSLLRLAGRFSREPATETRPVPALQTSARKLPEEGPRAPEVPSRKQPSVPERPSLAGGFSLKKPRPAPVEAAVPVAKEHRVTEAAPSPQKVAGESRPLRISEEIDPQWKNTLESVREASFAEYILLAQAVPTPPPSEWPQVDSAKPGPLELTLKYPFEQGFLVKLINEPPVLNRLTSRLEEVLERTIMLRIAQERSEGKDLITPGQTGQSGMYDGEGHVVGPDPQNGPSLFPGAARTAPTDPDLRRIHDLIVDDFPEYKVENEPST